ncbi:hypothetical protein QBC46DRAFT_24126 [Diplogelasinospora grovesii]|uniref:Uncharacterized protein n=1 Tax=Diplogelasinospora grovesii TaxID=303347 RepID=A0AAN6S197_9PEZI|nr:hypothetical protein QBC46DRAFT_24126 [Diplogelasinospora grovesii]
MSSTPTSSSSSEPSSKPAAPKPKAPTGGDPRLRAHLQSGKTIAFTVKTGGSKWQATLMHRDTFEKRQATRQDSSSSVQTLDTLKTNSSSLSSSSPTPSERDL